jgi:FkbM family methyltransferase
MEIKLWALLLLVADRGGFRRPRPGTTGWVIDAGANDGESTVMLADALRPLNLNVLAVEPLANNVESVRAKTQHMNNVEVLRAGLGEVNGSTIHYPKHFDFRPAGGDAQVSAFRPSATVGEGVYPVVTIDTLFGAERDRTLVLAHLDLEGREPDTLRGARATLLRDRPVVTVETYPKSMRPRHQKVMALFEALRYDVYTVEETVGTIRDGRNTVAIPREDHRLRWIVEHYFAKP